MLYIFRVFGIKGLYGFFFYCDCFVNLEFCFLDVVFFIMRLYRKNVIGEDIVNFFYYIYME